MDVPDNHFGVNWNIHLETEKNIGWVPGVRTFREDPKNWTLWCAAKTCGLTPVRPVSSRTPGEVIVRNVAWLEDEPALDEAALTYLMWGRASLTLDSLYADVTGETGDDPLAAIGWLLYTTPAPAREYAS